MDVDIARLEAVIPGYVVLVKDAGVEYVSEGLAKRLGLMADKLKKDLEGIPELFMSADLIPDPIVLPSAQAQEYRFTCTPIPMDGFRVIAFSEERPEHKPVIEYADRDTFVRMFTNAYMGCLVVDEEG
jgi:hypothetical protein